MADLGDQAADGAVVDPAMRDVAGSGHASDWSTVVEKTKARVPSLWLRVTKSSVCASVKARWRWERGLRGERKSSRSWTVCSKARRVQRAQPAGKAPRWR